MASLNHVGRERSPTDSHGRGGAMRAKRAKPKGDGDAGVYSITSLKEVEEQPLLDLRTRLVLWFLCLFFFGLVYLGLNGAPV